MQQSHSRRAFLGYGAALAVSSPWVGWAEPGLGVPLAAELGSVRAEGDLGRRTRQNMGRLEEAMYRPPMVFAGVNAKTWPGDIEGRALLAITLLARSTGEEPSYLGEMLPAYRARLNRQGCFGEALDVHAINEQQLSGHGWLLRGLCEYSEYKHDPAAMGMVSAIVENLALPLRGKYRSYPIDPAVRTGGGGVSGNLVGRRGDWVLSTDVGCAFIFLDGLAHAWVLTRDARLKEVIDEAIARFLQVDLVAMGAQTHATLTALRALLRVYGETRDPALLAAVRTRYQLYRAVGMTEHYANYNWFDRPETWTEPCAIIDSFMVAYQLWQFTGEPGYLEDAHRIWFNGVGRGMRGNGGFGTDKCAGYRTPFLSVRSYEAYFCCTMRGGEGHARAIQYSYATRGDEVMVPFFGDSEATLKLKSGTIRLRQQSEYPYDGAVRLEVVESTCTGPVTVRMFKAGWTAGHAVLLNGKGRPVANEAGFLAVRWRPKAGDRVELRQELLVRARDMLNPKSLRGYSVFEAGPLVLGHEGESEVRVGRGARLVRVGAGRYQVAGGDVVLSRINDLNELHVGPKEACTRQILFRGA